ncbi:ankyrin repeat domain-containing protein 54-like [Bombus vosnesenskii]|uniref:Ankyrin repeat domain-containing protein 54-like n=1 Tax=Bombus vosnesenskii TaxID=207650 RepID=A0A6J3K218_9HYME|nr:ankyrin repeat domain-containing protein 54-like [Bombus vosnesenskii]XP_050480459.1 ankyrin repeat domain-containing protein 54-like [Bombus huntii]
MTSVDSGIETSNNSDDSSIAQSEDMTMEEISNASSAPTIITCNNNYNEIQEIKPGIVHTIFKPNSSVCLSNMHDGVQNYTPASSSRPYIGVSPNVLEVKFPFKCNSVGSSTARTFLVNQHVYCSKIKLTKEKRRNRHFVSLVDDYTRLVQHRMRIAAATNNTMVMKILLDSNVSPNSGDKQGRTPLHLASCRGYTDMVRLLLEYGADPNLRDSVGNTPLHLAAVTSKISVVTLLLNAGTDPLCLDQYGYNPLHLAQTKLKLLQNCKGKDMMKIKDEVQSIISMLLAYLQKYKDTHESMETLSSLCSRLSLSNTSNQVQDDVKDLLANLNALSITK